MQRIGAQVETSGAQAIGPLVTQTTMERGCPYDCGLCPDHEQHSCLALIEINQNCNLKCPVCFAGSAPGKEGQLNPDAVDALLDVLMESEGKPDIVQISGGEPTIHPEILEILRRVKARPIRHVMLNTNGVRIARDPDFAKALADFAPGFEVYLQFDSLKSSTVSHLRGEDLVKVREQALENLGKVNLSTTLVSVVKRGWNLDEAGDIIRHALQHPCVRGVTFQPVQDAGRNEGFDRDDRVVLSEIRDAIANGGIFGKSDIVPLPCNPEYIAIGYGIRSGSRCTPLTGSLPLEWMAREVPPTVTFEQYPELQKKIADALSLSCPPEQQHRHLKELLCCLPAVEVPDHLTYEQIFRVTIVQFLDKYNFCLAGVKRSCIHFVTPDKRIIPFDTYNLFYRDPLEKAWRRTLPVLEAET